MKRKIFNFCLSNWRTSKAEQNELMSACILSLRLILRKICEALEALSSLFMSYVRKQNTDPLSTTKQMEGRWGDGKPVKSTWKRMAPYATVCMLSLPLGIPEASQKRDVLINICHNKPKQYIGAQKVLSISLKQSRKHTETLNMTWLNNLLHHPWPCNI